MGSWFSRLPIPKNTTLQEVEKRAKEECCSEKKKEEDKANEEAQEVNEEAQKANEEAQKAKEEVQKAREDAKEAIEEARKAKEEARKAKEEAQKAKEEAKEAKEEAKKARKEAKKANEETGNVKEGSGAQAAARHDEKAAVEALEWGIAPTKWPTVQEIAGAMAAIQYHPELLHFAICGTAGSGKSTLINALRGLKNMDEGAAKVGVVEMTSKITRYLDPRTEYPYSRFAWYDIPGAGTPNVPYWQYFIDQGLFIFDFIVMVYDIRFTQTDLGILENCRRFRIPVFVVRSKADQHIRNMANSAGYDEDEGPYKPWYEKFKPKYISETQADFEQNLRNAVAGQENLEPLLDFEKLYIISGQVLQGLVTTKEGSKLKEKDRYKIIHEDDLIMDMLEVGTERRYGYKYIDAVQHFIQHHTLHARRAIKTGKRAIGTKLSSLKSHAKTIFDSSQENSTELNGDGKETIGEVLSVRKVEVPLPKDEKISNDTQENNTEQSEIEKVECIAASKVEVSLFMYPKVSVGSQESGTEEKGGEKEHTEECIPAREAEVCLSRTAMANRNNTEQKERRRLPEEFSPLGK